MKPLNKLLCAKKVLPLAIACFSAPSFAVFSDAGTDYSKAKQGYHVWNEALNPVDLVNSILCFTGQLKANEFINAGPYVALADEAACFKNEGSNGGDNSQSAGAANTPAYVKIVVNATRESNTAPLIVKVWIPDMSGGGDQSRSIKFKSSIAKGASATDPFGSFVFNYNFFDSFTANNPQGGGEIKTVDVPNKIGFTLVESEAGGGRHSSKNASVVMSTDRLTGIALTSHSDSENNMTQGEAFALAFDADHVKMQFADDYASLPYKSNAAVNGSNQKCLSRTQFVESVWNYDLFDATTGSAISLKSGMPFKYDTNNDGSDDSFGYVGYWGLWAERGADITSGATIHVENRDTHAVTPYTVVKAPGRLIKNSVQQVSLADIHGVEFNYWSSDAKESNFDNWVVKYLTVAADSVDSDGFYKVAGVKNGQNGPSSTDIEPLALVLDLNETLHLNSQQLGGDINYQNGDSFITFFKREFINGSETGSNELLANGNVTLYCLDRCPVGTLGATELAGWNTPYLAPVVSVGNAVAYTFSNAGANALTLVRSANNEPVKYSVNLANLPVNSPYGWGFQSGTLVTQDVLNTLNTPWDVFNPEKVTVFYQWETGLNRYNQTVSVKDANGVVQSFDKPLQFTYTHTDANDRTGDAGKFKDKVLMLSYGGNGDLGGIPGNNGQDGRYRAGFTIKDGTLMGPNNRYVVKARQVEGTMKPTPGACTGLTITDPVAPVPLEPTGSADIGDMPVVTSEPKVIAGVLQTPTTP